MDLRRGCQCGRGVYCRSIMLNRTRKRILRSPLPAVLMLALVLRAAIPFGYMPAAAPDGGMRMEICPEHVLSAHDTTGARDDSHSGASQCPFALSALPPLPIAHAVRAIEPASLGEVGGLDLDLNITFTPAHLQQARAPPVSRLIQS
jgi:hypothetical protein